ncbi:Sorbitol dehydrogenase [uncultured Clostridium sp.]|uniref:NAD(P)-dependent alcohol dehydrogenase n=1 Tax=Flintibacter hominis TaxID=2763048 RepID=A0A8J6M6R9_9FIRM|nr:MULTISPECIES: NAD(P)-dependent alcohol dehydrogenase [Eubacteriales]MBC5722153.1 NAD(P)-dependent alcohol dehydrogenase [Flintibacter hominis]MCU6701468.1 NAD(P)-dependent alcohol dehydrogenase [Muriventricola aceti]SCH43580.1 Sorbitol dehydrogenase [uncultured Clostridium sp.]SCI61674.1 Sorbitol dehydrogenase [uncultured Flavonifractor sp.]
MENREALLLEPGKIQVFPCEMPVIQDDEVLVKMEYCGVCGSDVHYFRFGGIGRRKVTFPYVLGHECTGEVLEIGSKVTNVTVGDKVVMEPGLGCGHCEYCMTGRYNLCEDMKFMATPPYNGAFKKYMAYPARGCFKLPESVSTLEGAMIEPLAVGMHAARRGEVDNSKVVLITGMGCIGLMTLLSCKAMNAQKIIVTDIFQNRLEKALELGADYAINVAETDMLEKLKELTDEKGADVVFETAGRAQTAAQNVFAVRRGGVIVQVGTIADPVPYQFNELGKIEADIRSVFRYRNIFPLAIKLIEKGDIDLKAVDPDIFDFEDVDKAFDTAINRGNEVVKCILKF